MSRTRLPERPVGPLATPARRKRATSTLLALTTMLTPVLVNFTAAPASAASVSSAVFSGSAGTASVGDTLYAKQGATVTLTVVTSSDTQCVDVAGAFTAHQESTTAKTTWTFTTTAPAGDGAQAVTAAASDMNKQGKCTGQSATVQGSYRLDNTGPAVSASLSPAANVAGWNNTDTTVRWTATDAGSGVTAAQPFQTDTMTSNGIATATAPAQSDRLGNTGAAGSVTVRVDKAKPTITAAQTKNADGTTTVTFTCTDSNSGGGEAAGIASCVAEGTSPASSSKTVPGGTVVAGTATDRAGNASTASSTAPASDSTPPTITRAVAPNPNAAGWNKADATVTFSCADNTGGSGVKSCVADGGTTASRTVSTETDGTLVGGTATDNAGNTAKDSVTVKLDKTAPTAAASRTPATGNANGWNNTDVTVAFSAADALSGVASTTPNTVLGEGANQSATGTATDAAGNTSATASVTGVNVDKTAPTLSGTATADPNANGWYDGDVTVRWTAADALSGLAAAPANSTITGEGTGLTASASVTDKAGNAKSATSAPVKIDRTAPTTGISGTSNAWTNGAVTVSLAANDNLSTVARTEYTVDSGATQTGTSFTLDTEGDHTVTYRSTDKAGNVEALQTTEVRIDKTAPTIRHTFTPNAYVDGAWTNSDVTVTFVCADQGGSGLPSCTAPVTKTAEGSSTVTGTATDGAGNSATDSASVRIDKTKPTITATANGARNAAGWYKDDVTVSYTASDNQGGSGVSGSPASDVLGQGANQSASASVTDEAGNTSSAGVSGIDIDKTAPVLTGTVSSGWHTGDVTVDWSCTDALSGVAAQPADDTVTGAGSDLTSTATCTDVAGNTATRTVNGIKIDRTAPATGIAVAGETSNGWYLAGTSVTLTASDNLSGVAKTFYSVDGGAPQAYGDAVSVTADGTHTVTWWSTDVAGNVEDKTGNSVTLKVDKTPPTLTGKATTDPNANGWYAGDVKVAWTCTDATSGIATGTCPADSTVAGEGATLGASASVSDTAGNATNTTVGGIKIDRSGPTTQGKVPAPLASGWYGAPVEVTLTGSDNLSGIDATYYTVDADPAVKTYAGAFAFGTEGAHTIKFWSKDKAGNVETAGAPLTLKIDTTKPSTSVINPVSPDSGWFVTSGIPVAFKATDAGSGVAATYYTIDGGAKQTYGEPFTANLSDGTHTISYWSVDLAGNEEAHETTNVTRVSVDTTAPTISGATARPANGHGWFNADVAVTFTCADAAPGSGLQTGMAGCAGDTTVTNESETQTVPGDAVDVAGNKTHLDFGPVKLDKTAPTLAGALPTTGRTASGWYKDNVTVAWTGTDALSGIDPASQPADSTITGQGANLGATATMKDKAGNTGGGSVTGVKIDRTKPVVSGATVNDDGAVRAANDKGWFNSAVRVRYSATDDLSGVQEKSSDTVLSKDGAGQSATGSATDNADNVGSVTVSGINIDSEAPQTSANNVCEGKNGWCKGQKATVKLTAVDQTDLSGVKEIRYVVNGGQEKVAAGAVVEVDVPLAAKSGLATVEYYAVDNAGNAEAKGGVSLKFDNIAPTVTHTVNPDANAAGWNSTDTTVHFDAKDDDGGSGVDVATVTADVKVTAETSATGQVVNGKASDLAGNDGTDSVTVKLDRTAPGVTAAVKSGTKGANGFYTGPVTVGFTCSDALSDIATCPADVVLNSDGLDQKATGTAVDKAGNTASVTLTGISIDSTKPVITVAGAKASYLKGQATGITCSATDATSGVDGGCTITTSGGTNGMGLINYTATAKDKAGHVATSTGSYKVIYAWSGFLQPINDTAHQVDQGVSIFKGGSTVPAKFQVKDAAGNVVQVGSAEWLSPVKGSATSAAVSEAAYSEVATSGTTFKLDATSNQYHYNWSTKGSQVGFYHRIGVKLDDGQIYTVSIGLR